MLHYLCDQAGYVAGSRIFVVVECGSWSTDLLKSDEGFRFHSQSLDVTLFRRKILIYFLPTGSDTTATAFAATIFYLIHNPARLAELVAEVRAIFVDVEQIRSGPQLNGCVYLRACIDEALRLSPPALGLLPREALVGGIDIDNHHFPAGTVVGTPIYTLHHNEDYYTSPFTYNPSRWIVDPNKPAMAADVALARSAFCSFSVGPRSCVGKGFAYMELMLGLARLVWMYDMRLSPGSNVGEGDPEWEWGRRRRGEYQLKDTFAAIRDGPLVEFKPK